MKTLRHITLGALTAMAAAAAPAQAGFVVKGVHFMEPADFPAPQARVVKALQTLEVPVVDGGKMEMKHCEPLENGVYRLGFYVPGRNFMVLCTNNGDEAKMNETLTHEAVHVIQDIRGGFDNAQLVTLPNEINYYEATLPQTDMELITRLYDKSEWAEEIEARALENNPLLVADMLETEARRWSF